MWLHCASFLMGSCIFVAKPRLQTRAFSPECLSSPGRGCDSRVTTAGWQQLMFLLCFQLFFGGSCPPGGGGELWKSLRPLPSLPLAPPSHQLGKSCCLNVKPPGATPAAPSGLSEVALLPRGAPRAVPALSLSPGCHLEPEAAQPWCCSLCDKRAVSLVNKWLLFLIPLLPNSFPPREGLSSALELPKTPGFLENGDFGVTSRAVPGWGGEPPEVPLQPWGQGHCCPHPVLLSHRIPNRFGMGGNLKLGPVPASPCHGEPSRLLLSWFRAKFRTKTLWGDL